MRNLPEQLKRTLERLTNSGITEGFYLAGGTAIAARYGHRESEDLDFFTLPGKELDVDKMTALLREDARWIRIDSGTAIFIYLPENVKVSFFSYHYPLVREPELSKELNIFIASDLDIACMKAIAIAQRGSKKDFYDLWFLLRHHTWSIETLETALKEKIPYWDFGIFLRSLTYFEDADKESYSQIDERWEDIKGFFKEQVRLYSREEHYPEP